MTAHLLLGTQPNLSRPKLRSSFVHSSSFSHRRPVDPTCLWQKEIYFPVAAFEAFSGLPPSSFVVPSPLLLTTPFRQWVIAVLSDLLLKVGEQSSHLKHPLSHPTTHRPKLTSAPSFGREPSASFTKPLGTKGVIYDPQYLETIQDIALIIRTNSSSGSSHPLRMGAYAWGGTVTPISV